MKLQNTMIFVLFMILVVAVSGCSNAQTPPETNTNTNPAASNSASTNTNVQVKQNIGDSQYANIAYLISGDTLDSATKNAISGFNIDKTTNSDGTTTIKLTSTNPEYQNQSYTLQSGQKLYFIEMNLGDDFDNQEGNIRDDRAVVTDADGNIIQQ